MMQLTAFRVLFSTFVVRQCLAGLAVQKYNPDQATLVEASIDILESCYGDRFSTVGLAGPAAGSILKRMALRNSVASVTLVDAISGGASDDPIDNALRHKLQVFAVTVTDSNTTVDTLMKVRNSTWWNHMASFVLIDQSGMNNGCSNAYEILWEAWRINLLNSKFMCVDPTRGMLIYTFNPYMGKAPVPWQQENTYEGINGHVWTLFVQEYRDAKSHCNELDFDKTLDLGGYEICVSLASTSWWYRNSTKKMAIMERMEELTAQILKDSLNATWKLSLQSVKPKKNEPLSFDDSGREVASGNSDVLLHIIIQHDSEGYDISYPHTIVSMAILTQYRGNKSQLEKIISVLDRSSRFGVVVVLLITLSFFKFYMRKPLIPAILDLVLITCNAGLQKIPENLAPRIYFGSLFIFVVTIQGIYSGKLATLLTSNVRLQNINSIDDLAQSDHTIYGYTSYKVFFNTSAFEGRFVAELDPNCTEQVLRDPKAACVGPTIQLLAEAATSKLHLSAESIGVVRGVYVIRPDWPLEQRVNAIYDSAVTTGISDFLLTRALQSETKKLESYEYDYEHQDVKVIALENLIFAFIILAIGLGCATITFIIEVAIYGKAIAKPGRR